MKMRGGGIIVNFSSIFLNDEWDMKGCEEEGMMMMVVRMGRGVLAHHERVIHVRKEGGYNIMKEQASQVVVKSTFVLENGGKIFKWWVAVVKMEAFHEYGDWRCMVEGCEKVPGPIVEIRSRNRKGENARENGCET
jgi:hypothetical protein